MILSSRSTSTTVDSAKVPDRAANEREDGHQVTRPELENTAQSGTSTSVGFDPCRDSRGGDLVEQIIVRLRARLGCSVRSFQIRVYPDGIVLRGQVRSYYIKQMVQQVARDISGRTVLANDLDVCPVELA